MKHSIDRNMLHICVAAILFVTLINAFWSPEYSHAQESHCDPNLKVLPDNPLGYRLRDDRCEGIYIKEVGNTTLIVASLTEPFKDNDFFSRQELTINWAVPNNWRVRLRAQSLRRRLYYRMDTLHSADSTTYTWPLNILSALKIRNRSRGQLIRKISFHHRNASVLFEHEL